MMTGNQCDIFPCFLSEERMLQGSWLLVWIPKETGANISEEKGGGFYGFTYLWTMSERKCNQKENVICSKYSVWFVGGQRQEVFDGKNDSGW